MSQQIKVTRPHGSPVTTFAAKCNIYVTLGVYFLFLHGLSVLHDLVTESLSSSKKFHYFVIVAAKYNMFTAMQILIK